MAPPFLPCRMLLHRNFQWLTTSSTLVYCVSKMSDYSQAQVLRLVALQGSLIVTGAMATLMTSWFKCKLRHPTTAAGQLWCYHCSCNIAHFRQLKIAGHVSLHLCCTPNGVVCKTFLESLLHAGLNTQRCQAALLMIWHLRRQHSTNKCVNRKAHTNGVFVIVYSLFNHNTNRQHK